MYLEERLAEAIGIKRAEIAPHRTQERTKTSGKGGTILWTQGGVMELLEALGIPPEKTPPELMDELLMGAEEKSVRDGELVVHRVPGNPETTHVILAKDGETVVRVLIRPGTGRAYRPGLRIYAKEKSIGFWKVDMARTRLQG